MQPQAGEGRAGGVLPLQDQDGHEEAGEEGRQADHDHDHSIKGTAPTRAELLKPYNGRVPAGFEVLKVPAHRLVVSCAAATGCLGASAASKTGTYYYLFKYFPNNPEGPPELTGKDLDSSGIRADIDPSSGQWTTLLSFTGHGSKMFQKITKAEYERGKIASGLAGRGATATRPAVRRSLRDRPRQSASVDAVHRLHRRPHYRTESRRCADHDRVAVRGEEPRAHPPDRSAAGQLQADRAHRSLGHAREGVADPGVARGAVGLIAVALFLLVLYRFLGLVAVFGLAIYALLYYAAIQLFNVTLTLPGFAGLILTIGVAADANVVVFERIKEEVRAGRSVRAAVATGYKRASTRFSTRTSSRRSPHSCCS